MEKRTKAIEQHHATEKGKRVLLPYFTHNILALFYCVATFNNSAMMNLRKLLSLR